MPSHCPVQQSIFERVRLYSRGTGEILKEVVEVHEGEEKDKHSKNNNQQERTGLQTHDTDFGLFAEIGE